MQSLLHNCCQTHLHNSDMLQTDCRVLQTDCILILGKSAVGMQLVGGLQTDCTAYCAAGLQTCCKGDCKGTVFLCGVLHLVGNLLITFHNQNNQIPLCFIYFNLRIFSFLLAIERMSTMFSRVSCNDHVIVQYCRSISEYIERSRPIL